MHPFEQRLQLLGPGLSLQQFLYFDVAKFCRRNQLTLVRRQGILQTEFAGIDGGSELGVVLGKAASNPT